MTAAVTVLDQNPLPFPWPHAGEILTQAIEAPGATLYVSIATAPKSGGPQLRLAQSAVPAALGAQLRNLRLTDAKSDAAVSLTASATSGAMGVARTAGSSLALVGEATSSNAKTDQALFEFNLPDSYVSGANLAFDVNCETTGSGTLNAASTTMAVAALSEVNGGETPLPVSAAQEIPATAGDLIFTVAGAGLVPGSHVVLELAMLITSSSGANVGQVNSISYTA